MRIQTIHRNPMGDVLNECSAQGFRITNAEGNSITVTVEGDQIIIEGSPFVTGYYDSKRRALRMIPNGISGKKPTGVIIDEQMPAAVEGFDEWYDSVDARFWNNRDACNAAFHAGKRAAQQPAAEARGVVDWERLMAAFAQQTAPPSAPVGVEANELAGVRARLKSGDYDGTDIMRAWIAIDTLLATQHQEPTT